MDFETVAGLHSAYKSKSVSTVIDEADAMYKGGPAHYYKVGQSAINVILSGLTLSWIMQVRRVLDIPCGHGRIARHLAAAFPDAELFFSDLSRPGADFCSAQFKGTAVYSKPDLLTVDLPKDLDVIWVGSLFTHLDRERALRWLSYLAEHLREHGILVATFHGYFSDKVANFGAKFDGEKLRREFAATGYGYVSSKDWEDCGVSLAKPSAILDMADTIPGTKVIAYTERGWANNHDVLILCHADRLKPW